MEQHANCEQHRFLNNDESQFRKYAEELFDHQIRYVNTGNDYEAYRKQKEERRKAEKAGKEWKPPATGKRSAKLLTEATEDVYCAAIEERDYWKARCLEEVKILGVEKVKAMKLEAVLTYYEPYEYERFTASGDKGKDK